MAPRGHALRHDSAAATLVGFARTLRSAGVDASTDRVLEALRALDVFTKWNGPYLKKSVPLDPLSQTHLLQLTAQAAGAGVAK
jgi:uncharacterized protein with von Willebrand factor type A (vWA) domain